MTHPTQPQATREALLGKLRRIGYLLQQMNAQEAAAAVREAAEVIELTTPPPQAQEAVVVDEVPRQYALGLPALRELVRMMREDNRSIFWIVNMDRDHYAGLLEGVTNNIEQLGSISPNTGAQG